MKVFTLGTVTVSKGNIQNVASTSSIHATATLPLQATLPFGWLIAGVALLSLFQSLTLIIPTTTMWRLCLLKSINLVSALLLLFVTVYSHLLLVAAGLEAYFLYLYASIYFLQSVNAARFICRLWLCYLCRSKAPLLYDANYFVCWHTNNCDYCIPYDSITETIVITSSDGTGRLNKDYQIGGYLQAWQSGVKDYVVLRGYFTEIHYQLESTQVRTDTGIDHHTYFIYSRIRSTADVVIHTIDGSSGVVNPAMDPIYDEPTTTTSVPL